MAIEVCDRRRRIDVCDWRRMYDRRGRYGGSPSLVNGYDRRSLFHRASQNIWLFGSAHGALGESRMMQIAPERGSDHDNCHRTILHEYLSFTHPQTRDFTVYTLYRAFRTENRCAQCGSKTKIFFGFGYFLDMKRPRNIPLAWSHDRHRPTTRLAPARPQTGRGHWWDLPPPIHRAEISWVHGRGRNRNPE
jgi:hypothetical protein